VDVVGKDEGFPDVAFVVGSWGVISGIDTDEDLLESAFSFATCRGALGVTGFATESFCGVLGPLGLFGPCADDVFLGVGIGGSTFSVDFREAPVVFGAEESVNDEASGEDGDTFLELDRELEEEGTSRCIPTPNPVGGFLDSEARSKLSCEELFTPTLSLDEEAGDDRPVLLGVGDPLDPDWATTPGR